jgi:hypothetical protein
MKRDSYQNQPSENWDKALDRALKNLPERPAPADLVSQVMSKVNTNTTMKLSRHLWWRWPLWLRLPAGILLPALIVWLSLLGTRFYETRMSPALSRSVDICRTVFESMTEAFTGIQFGFDGDTYRIIFFAVSLLMLGMYLTCIGVGTFIYRTVRR